MYSRIKTNYNNLHRLLVYLVDQMMEFEVVIPTIDLDLAKNYYKIFPLWVI